MYKFNVPIIGCRFHALFHHCYLCPKACVCGGHAYSQDGVEWHYPFITGEAYNQFANVTRASRGSGKVEVVEFTKRERPHLVFGKDGVTPVALTNGAGVDGIGKYGDHTWTFLQPLGTSTESVGGGEQGNLREK